MKSLEERLKARRAELQAELEKYVTAANQQIVAYQAAIGEIDKLLQPEPEPQPEPAPVPEPIE